MDGPLFTPGGGRALYTVLLKLLPLQGFYQAFAGIALPNAGSVGLHEAVGFQPLGVYRQVGYKLGQWHDVGWWQLALQTQNIAPSALVPVGVLQGSEGWHTTLTTGLPLLRL